MSSQDRVKQEMDAFHTGQGDMMSDAKMNENLGYPADKVFWRLIYCTGIFTECILPFLWDDVAVLAWAMTLGTGVKGNPHVTYRNIIRALCKKKLRRTLHFFNTEHLPHQYIRLPDHQIIEEIIESDMRQLKYQLVDVGLERIPRAYHRDVFSMDVCHIHEVTDSGGMPQSNCVKEITVWVQFDQEYRCVRCFTRTSRVHGHAEELPHPLGPHGRFACLVEAPRPSAGGGARAVM